MSDKGQHINRRVLVSELIEEIRADKSLSHIHELLRKEDLNRIIVLLIGVFKRGLLNNRDIKFATFGTLYVHERNPRKGMKPTTTDKVDVPRKVVVKFRTAKDFVIELTESILQVS